MSQHKDLSRSLESIINKCLLNEQNYFKLDQIKSRYSIQRNEINDNINSNNLFIIRSIPDTAPLIDDFKELSVESLVEEPFKYLFDRTLAALSSSSNLGSSSLFINNLRSLPIPYKRRIGVYNDIHIQILKITALCNESLIKKPSILELIGFKSSSDLNERIRYHINTLANRLSKTPGALFDHTVISALSEVNMDGFEVLFASHESINLLEEVEQARLHHTKRYGGRTTSPLIRRYKPSNKLTFSTPSMQH